MPAQTYSDTVSAYAAQLRGLFAVPAGAPAAERRRGVTVDPGLLNQRAAALADLSLELGAQTGALVDAPDRSVAAAAELRLLAQANAEFEVAGALLSAVEEQARPGGAPGAPRRSGGYIAGAARAVNDLAGVLEQPLPAAAPQPARAGGAADPAAARLALQDQARRSLKDITRQAGKTSSLALDLLFSLDGETLKKVVAPLNKEISELVAKAAGLLNEKIKSLLQTAVRFLLQAYDWVLALIGKDAEQAARKKVQGWIEELRTSHQQTGDTPGLAEQLVGGLFATAAINTEVEGWVKTSQAAADQASQAAAAVKALAEAYAVKAERVKSFLKAVQSVPKAATAAVAGLTAVNPGLGASLAGLLPALELLRGAITLGLMGYTLFAGYDHVDSGQATFFKRFSVKIPDRVAGVRETVQKALA